MWNVAVWMIIAGFVITAAGVTYSWWTNRHHNNVVDLTKYRRLRPSDAKKFNDRGRLD